MCESVRRERRKYENEESHIGERERERETDNVVRGVLAAEAVIGYDCHFRLKIR